MRSYTSILREINRRDIVGFMKIRYVTIARLPTDRAHGYAIMKMCEEFASLGHDVELLVPDRHLGISDDPFSYYAIKKNFTLRKLFATDLLGRFGHALAFYIDLISFLLSVRKLKFSENAVVYTRDFLVAAFVPADNLVLEVHNISERSLLFRRAARRSRKLVVISEGLKRALTHSGIPGDKIVVAPDAVDLAELEVPPSRGLWRTFGVDPEKKIALYTGHFYGWKGAATLAEAGRYLPDTEIVLMGGVDRELADFQEKYASKHVHVIGFQKRNTLARILKSADVLILPNSGMAKISAYYTSPLKLFQYMASGIPIIASELPSIREVLDDSSGFWFKADDARALADRIEYVLAHPSEAQAKADRARERAQRYTWDARARTIASHIER